MKTAQIQQTGSGSPPSEVIKAHPAWDGHEQVVIRDSGGLHAIIAVHSTRLGPAAGGCRIFPYASLDDALTDVLRLSRAMSCKSALAGLPLGGGKSVIIADPALDKSDKLLLAMGGFIDSLEGRYIAAEDSGTTVEDIRVMARRTRHVAGCIDHERHGGDPSPVTAHGVLIGIIEAMRHRSGRGLEGVRVGIQGVGNVGFHLAGLLQERGAQVVVADLDAGRVAATVKAHKVASCAVGEIITADVDVIAPCALGGAINQDNVQHIRAGIVAGGANNQLADGALGETLRERGILYAPDYVINAGGIIDIWYQRKGERDAGRIEAHLDVIRRNLLTIFEQSEQRRCSTHLIADELARDKLQTGQTREAAA